MRKWIVGLVASGAIASAALLYAQQQRAGGSLTTQDYIEIQQLYATYAQAYDRGDTAGYYQTAFIQAMTAPGGQAVFRGAGLQPLPAR